MVGRQNTPYNQTVLLRRHFLMKIVLTSDLLEIWRTNEIQSKIIRAFSRKNKALLKNTSWPLINASSFVGLQATVSATSI